MVLQKATQATLVGIAAAVILAGFVGALLTANQTLNNAGTVKGVGVDVFWDRGCTNKTLSIDWGALSPGEIKNCVIYVKNSGNTAEVLSMRVDAWSPSNASSYVGVGWNCTSHVLSHGSVVGALLTLSVSSNMTGNVNFSFNMTITGTENI